ncbi:UDP-N-acetylglucosamine 2-epimerase (non-hydrolyzing) [Sphingomonas naphthae]|uniref:UDP-N-acetylglucosamine 2-epimerase (non-hydrolyzing) n=1 Tax=Sphingomonas naphthae TaxID=1813468 RepID=A0ABY7TQ89_9SPHN|nr:UDP-N-acetylglucosamine 2-epimerase (non-hydrolyzing) [Sphingomonas naphthae]WCT75298.1 UDP-N-acetylglucosamine 2-epimerase (non-hydrolyzing) [Sphingomonas naphthae]
MASEPRRILLIGGTRPEAIKLAPLLLAAEGRPDLRLRLIATGQHPEMFADALHAFGLKADRTLPPARPGDTIENLADRIARALPALLAEIAPDIVLVQGDTTSAWAAARVAHQAGSAVGHVEAGLRSGDLNMPWPEERNRVQIDALSTMLFAPTVEAARHLRHEGVPGRVFVTGNTGIDALLWMRRNVALHRHSDRRLILVTAHRRENVAHLPAICRALRTIAARGDVSILLPVHPNPAVAAVVERELAGVPDIELTPALTYPAMVALMAQAHLLLTDSGGLQEEAPAIGLPTLVLRDVTERPEALATGNLAMVGTVPRRIVAAARRLLDDARAHAAMSRPAFPYGDGQAAHRILDAIVAHPLPRRAALR